MNVREIIDYLKAYDGPEIKLMEVCGTHTAAIFKNGIRELISPKIKLISGPGCPVCVTPTAYIDKVAEYAMMDSHVVLTFGDMMKVPGTGGSLSQLKGKGAKVELMYSPFEAVEKAKADPDTTYVIAAVGFETTAPAYALMIDEAKKQGLKNIKLVTALKTVIPALTWICENQTDIDGFICPGHVSVIIGSRPYEQLAEKYGKPFVVAGFEAEHILAVIYDIVKQLESGKGKVDNLYTNAVKDEGNKKALAILEKCFEPGEAMWRGLGIIPGSGLYLTGGYEEYDGGSRGLDSDMELPKECACGQVITGRINPDQCKMFGTGCTPMEPYGPCMVSAEGACGIWYRNR
ncbi:MAG: hydrogenase formation protein HypD [Eubacteriaceae bacterium]|nr:hydrogenase formation protein HypD [Eubacteriaceae bacterium]